MKQAIIIFQKNAKLGHVKTRLAADVGNEKALEIYQFLCAHTHAQIEAVQADKYLYYSQEIEVEKQHEGYHYRVQEGADLGERMYNAFQELFEMGYERVLITGTDCYEMQTKHLQAAFEQLNTNPYVFGPAKDGGYYLLACSRLDKGLFIDRKWSHAKVLEEALQFLKNMKLGVTLIECLSDIDTAMDLGELRTRFDL